MKHISILGMAAAMVLLSQMAQADVGEDTYNKACASCHVAGVAGAPKLGDKAAWGLRIAKGLDALYASSLNGIPGTAMIAKGGQALLADDVVKAAVDYMVSKAQ